MPHKSPRVISAREKPAIILIHGFRGSPLGLEAIATDLHNAGYEVYLPPIPPFAGTEGVLADYSPEAYAKYIKDYITGHHLFRPVLIGHSMGSVVASATAKLYPSLVNRRLILLSPIATKPLLPFRVIAPLAAIVPNHIVDYMTTRFLFVPHDKKLFRETMQLTHQCSHDQAPNKSAIAAATKFSTNYCVNDFSPNCKVALIAGAKDRLVGRRNIEKLAAQLQAPLTLLENSGHLHNYEQPHATADAILEFLQS